MSNSKTSVTTFGEGYVIKPGEKQNYSAASEDGVWYSFNVSKAFSTVDKKQAVLTIINGWASGPGTSNGPWCSVENTSADPVKYNLLILSVKS
ncbi:hypothetical protein H2O64_08235 [Kordia sp. YSTF-M3]|uniref:Uncharacterized protein n=1 Tax=Kordia aestuariivivens TaxID=2759037 RepID=A0ABR7Q7W6_9FLAO|nr:hypothetical protein [Kordia aestuariivivens]MBC8754660.1 hypothetical protein [Kordia aestuariivivens]